MTNIFKNSFIQIAIQNDNKIAVTKYLHGFFVQNSVFPMYLHGMIFHEFPLYFVKSMFYLRGQK